MKPTVLFLLTLVFLSHTGHVFGQVKPLPYATGFDNFLQQVGWKNYRIKGSSNYQWSVVSFSQPYSAPNSAFHDYPVGGTPTDTVIDWFVSPPFKIVTGGTLKLKINAFSYIPDPSDYFGIWVSTSSGTPSAGTFTQVSDLTLMASNTGWKDTTIDIPFTGNAVYIAFKYKETNNWFTINLDDINLTEKSTVNEIAGFRNPEPLSFDIAPNLFSGSSTLSWSAPGTEKTSLRIWNQAGQLMRELPLHAGKGRQQLDLSGMSAGMYFCQLQSETGLSSTRKIQLLK